MAKIADATFTGRSGTKYTFEVYPRNTNFNDVGGVYIFSERTSEGRHTVLYVGQTQSFEERRLAHHEQWTKCAEERGGNVICTHIENSSLTRQRIERDLIEAHNPPCNSR